MADLLVIDDDVSLGEYLKSEFGGLGHRVDILDDPDRGPDVLESRHYDLVLLDHRLPGTSGMDLLAEMRRRSPGMPIVLMTGHSGAELGIQAMRAGAFDYIVKPPDLKEMVGELSRLLDGAVVNSRQRAEAAEAAEAARASEAAARAAAGDIEGGRRPGTPAGPSASPAAEWEIIGRSRAMQAVCKLIGQVADSDAPVLVRGETGTGKELVARAVWRNSRRSARPLVAVNCAAIPEPLLESELFGHERGAFTGADRRRVGKFEQADGGTIFLDEIGDMSPNVQAKILRVLQEGEVLRLGAEQPVKVDVRVIAASHRDFESAIRDGQFREDLFWRLNGVTVRLPPLRERLEDLPLLVDRLLARLAGGAIGYAGGRPNPGVGTGVRPRLQPAAWTKLKAHTWPGNIRELNNVLRRAVLVCRGGVVTADDLEIIPGPRGGPRSGRRANDAPAGPVAETTVGAAGSVAPAAPGAAGRPTADGQRLLRGDDKRSRRRAFRVSCGGGEFGGGRPVRGLRGRPDPDKLRRRPRGRRPGRGRGGPPPGRAVGDVRRRGDGPVPDAARLDGAGAAGPGAGRIRRQPGPGGPTAGNRPQHAAGQDGDLWLGMRPGPAPLPPLRPSRPSQPSRP
jgi:DNA-binding NtrC family response regulator